MKKSLALILALVLALSLSACEYSIGPNDTGGDAPSTSPSVPLTEESPGSSADVHTETPEETPDNNNNNNSNNSGGGRASEAYFDLFDSGIYHTKARITGEDGTEGVMDIYAKDGMVAVMAESEGESMWIINRDGRAYMLLVDSKTYMVSDMTEDTSSGMVNTEGMDFTGSGTDEFDGRTLPYEEYSDQDGNQTQYFIDGGALAGVRAISSGIVSDVVILELDQNVPGEVFEVPSDYEEISWGD